MPSFDSYFHMNCFEMNESIASVLHKSQILCSEFMVCTQANAIYCWFLFKTFGKEASDICHLHKKWTWALTQGNQGLWDKSTKLHCWIQFCSCQWGSLLYFWRYFRQGFTGILGGFLLILMGVITDRQTEPDCLALVYMR